MIMKNGCSRTCAVNHSVKMTGIRFYAGTPENFVTTANDYLYRIDCNRMNTQNFTISKCGVDTDKETYGGHGRMSSDGRVLIIRANSPYYGEHELHCDLDNPANSKCYYHDTDHFPEPVMASIRELEEDKGFIQFVWAENGTLWFVEGELSD